MNYLLPVFYAVLQLVALIAVGFVARRIMLFSDQFFQELSRFVVRVALPLYFVVRVGKADLSSLGDAVAMPIAAAVILGIGIAASLLLFRFLPFTGSAKRAGIAMSTFGNSGYMPLTLATIFPASLPIISRQTGTELPLVLIAAYVLFFSPLLWSVGRSVMSRTNEQSRIRLKDLISPPLVGIAIGLVIALFGLQSVIANRSLPLYHLFEAVDLLSAVTLPLALICLGALIGSLQVTREALRHYLGLALSVALIRYLLLPLGFIFAMRSGLLSTLGPAALFVVFLESHTPPATNLSLMANDSGVNREHAAVTLLVGYALYLLLMPAYLLLFLSLADF
jgi:predicted permease